DGTGHGGCAGVDAELRVDVREVRLDRRLAHEQAASHLAVRLAGREQAEDLYLALGQLRAGSPYQSGRDGRREYGLAAPGAPDRAEEVLGRRILQQIAGRTRVDRAHDVRFGVVRRQHQDVRRFRQRPQPRRGLSTARPGTEVQIHQYDVRPDRSHQLLRTVR